MTMFGYNTLGFGSFPNRFVGMVATGGTITTDGDFKVHTFNSSGTFEVTTVGEIGTVEYLVIAGGASGLLLLENLLVVELVQNQWLLLVLSLTQ